MREKSKESDVNVCLCEFVRKNLSLSDMIISIFN